MVGGLAIERGTGGEEGAEKTSSHTLWVADLVAEGQRNSRETCGADTRAHRIRGCGGCRKGASRTLEVGVVRCPFPGLVREAQMLISGFNVRDTCAHRLRILVTLRSQRFAAIVD